MGLSAAEIDAKYGGKPQAGAGGGTGAPYVPTAKPGGRTPAEIDRLFSVPEKTRIADTLSRVADEQKKIGEERVTAAAAAVSLAKKPAPPAGASSSWIGGDVIASPEYFAKSLDVRNGSGRTVKVFEGPDAYEKAVTYAIEIGGSVDVSPKLGFLGRAARNVKEAFTQLETKARGSGGKLFDLATGTKDGAPDRPVVLDAAGQFKGYGPAPARAPGELAGSAISALTDAGNFALATAFAPVTAAFVAGPEIPVVKYAAIPLNYLFGKLGEAGGWVGDKVVDELPVSDATKENIREPVKELSSTLAQLAGAELGARAAKIGLARTAELRADIRFKLTKDLVEQGVLPRTVRIEAAKVKDIFQTGEKISPEELDLIRSLGLDAKQYKQAIKDGITIEVPSERVVTIQDKPYWAKIKSLFGRESVPEVTRTGSERARQVPNEAGPALALEGPSGRSVPVVPPLGREPAPAPVEAVLSAPASPKALALAKAFSPDEAAAFGRRILENIEDELGSLEVGGALDQIPESVVMNPAESPDGRPAQFNAQGRIEVFVPNLLKDLATLARGGRVLAHEGAYSKVYELKEGQTMEELATSYIRDTLVHEKSHEKTITIEDAQRIEGLSRLVDEARVSGDQRAIQSAKIELDRFLTTLETKALEYEKGNREALEKDLFGERKTATPTQRAINEATGIGGKVVRRVITEKQALRAQFKSRGRGMKEGIKEGKAIGEKKVTETKARYEEVLQRIKDKDASIFDKQTALADWATAFLPAADRGKFIKAVKNTRTDKDFAEVLARMQKAADLTERAGLVQTIKSELKETVIRKKNGMPDTKFSLQEQRDLNRIRANVSGDWLDAQQKIAELVSDFQAKNPDESLPLSLIQEIQFLNMVGISDMSAKQLRRVLDDIRSIKENGRTTKMVELFNRETERQRNREKAIDVITGGKELPSSKQSLKRPPEVSARRKALDFLTKSQWGVEELVDSLSRFDKGSKPYESFLSKFVEDRTYEPYAKQNAGELAEITKVQDTVREVYGVGDGFFDNRRLMSLLGDLQERVDLGMVPHADGVDRNLTISRGEAVQMEMWLRDPTLADTFVKGLNWGEAVIERMRSILRPEDLVLADRLLDFYREYYKGVNEVFVEDFGIDMPFNENYSPVTRNVETTLPESVLLANEVQKYATARNNSLKARTRNNIELKPLDALENLVRHIARMEHYKAWTKGMGDLRSVFNSKEVRQAIIDLHGKRALEVMDGFLQSFARDGTSRELVVSAADKLRINATAALLGVNWRVAIKQLTGISNYLVETPVVDFFTGLASFAVDPLKKSQFLYDNSPVLQERFGAGFDRDIKFALRQGYVKQIAGIKTLRDAMYVLIRTADKMTVYPGSWAAYRSKYMEVKRAGGTNAEAKDAGIRFAEVVTNRIQESSRPDTLSEIQRGGSLMKLFTMFAGQPTKYLRVMENAARNYKYGRGSRATNIKRLVVAWILPQLMYNLLSNALTDDKYKKSAGQIALQTALGPLSWPLIVGQMYQSVYGWISGEPFGYSPSAVFTFMEDLQKGIQNLRAGDIAEGITYVADTIGKVGGVPTMLLTRPVRKALKEEGPASSGSAVTF